MNLPWFVRVIMAGVVIVALAAVSLGPGYRWFREWRTDRNFASAKAALEERRTVAARDLTLSVLRAGRQDIEVFRLLEETMRELGDAWHPQIARALVTHPGQTRDDRLVGFRGVAANSPLGLVGQVWNLLEDDDQRQTGFAVAFSDRLMAEERWNEALIVLLGVEENERTPAIWARLARAVIQTGEARNVVEAQRMLATHPPSAAADLASWLDALELIPTPRLRKDVLDREEVMQTLDGAAGAGDARAAIAAVRIRHPGADSRAREAHEKAVREWGPSGADAIASWFMADGRHEAFIGFAMAHEGPLAGATVRLVHRLLMEREDAEGALAWIERHAEAIAPHERQALRAVAFAALGSSARVEAWSLAMEEASTAAPDNGYLTIYRIVSGAGLEREAEQAMLGAIRLNRGALPLFEELRPLVVSLAESGQELVLLDLLRVYLAMEPSNPVLLTQYAYLATLNGLADPALVLEVLEPMADLLAGELPFQFARAAIHACAGDFAMAASILEPYHADTGHLAPANKAMLLVVRVRVGGLAPDAREIRDFPWRSLQPSERRRFQEMIGAS